MAIITGILTVLRVGLVVLGFLSVLWGIYDCFGDSSSQSSVGVKKIVGGIIFAALSFFIMTAVMKELDTALSEVGMTTGGGGSTTPTSIVINHERDDTDITISILNR